MGKLAIIIPAYKGQFLKETLQSIEDQTCKNFHLYIGDDFSPADLKSIVKGTLKTTPYTYKRFSNNLGSIDLVGHWNRCIEMTKGEEWIWLFSDDDRMNSNCVDTVQRKILQGDSKIYRFNKQLINEQSKIIEQINLPECISFDEFLNHMFVNKLHITMTEFVFSKKLYDDHSIVKFPLAWGSDLATWLQYVYSNKCLISINDALIQFRISNSHISGQNSNFVLEQKLKANILFIKWFLLFQKYLKLESKLLIDEIAKSNERKVWMVKNAMPLSFISKLWFALFMFKIFPLKKAFKEASQILLITDFINEVFKK